MAKKKVKSEEIEEETDELKESPTDALVEYTLSKDSEVLGYFLVLIAYLFILLFLVNLFPSSVSLIIWIVLGFIIYKIAEKYGGHLSWVSNAIEYLQNIGFTVEQKKIEGKEKEDWNLNHYTERFDEWKIAKYAVQEPFISAGDNIRSFSFNSKRLYKLRLWMFLLLVPLLIWIIMWDIVSWPFMIWFNFWFSIEDASNLSKVCSLLLSYFIIIRIYSHCTNNRNLPINSDMLSDYDPYVIKHLFRIPNDKDSAINTSKALLFDFIGGYLLIIFTSFYAVQSYDTITRFSLDGFFSDGYVSLISTILCIAIFVPIMEELMFRGFVLDLATEAYGKWASIFISAILFALIHPLYILTVLNAFWAGLIYGYLRIRTNSLWPSIILHSFWNAHLILLEFFFGA